MTLPYKNIRLSFLLLEGLKLALSVREKQRQRRRTLTQAEGEVLYWNFRNSRRDILGPCFFDNRFSTGVRQSTGWQLSEPLACPNLFCLTGWPWLTVTDPLVSGHPCIFNFITPTRFFLFVIYVICLYPCIACFPVITSCGEISDGSVKGKYARIDAWMKFV